MTSVKLICPPTKAPNVTAGFKWPPEMLAALATPAQTPNPWANAAITIPVGVLGPLPVSLLKAMPEPSPAKTNIRVQKNSANGALNIARGVFPEGMIVIRLIGIVMRWITINV